MSPQETVRTLMDALQRGDFKTARSLLSRDFRFSGSVPEPLGAGPWIGLSANLKTAFPNLNYHFGIRGATGTVVKISARLTGTHTGNLNLTALGMGIMPATGKSFSMAYEEGEVTACDDQATAWKAHPCEGAGLMTILAHLTRAVPSHPLRAGGRLPSGLSVSRRDEPHNVSTVTLQKGQARHA